MNKLSKQQEKQKQDITEALYKAEQNLSEVIQTFNAKHIELFEPVTAAIDLVNEIRGNAKSLTEEISQELEDYVSERSDKWHEGDKADQYSSMISAYEDIYLDDIEIDPPTEIEEPDYVADEFNNLQNNVEDY